MENFVFFVVFDVTLRHFHLENCSKLFAKAYLTTHFLLFDPYQRSNSQSPSKIWKKCLKSLKIGQILGFLSFSESILDLFLPENSNNLFIEDYWTTSLCLVERFQHSFTSYNNIYQEILALNRIKMEVFCFLRSFLDHSGVLGSTNKVQKSPRIQIARS